MSRKRRSHGVARRAGGWVVRLCLLYLAGVLLGLILFRFTAPPTTSVQIQRSFEARISGIPYQRDYRFVPLEEISVHLQHAVVAAEDGRFYQHSGVDWKEVGKVLEEELPKGRLRGASTITQQLVKNLFMTTHPIPLRKPVEWALAPVADKVLGKRRQLELYLNIVEWGPGIFGADAAARHHFGVSAKSLGRQKSARLAAVLPSPRKWKPQRMDEYTAIILKRMAQRGW